MNMPEDVGDPTSRSSPGTVLSHVFSKGRGLNQHVLAGPEGPKPLLLLAVDEQRGKYVEPVVEGRKSTAFAQTEPTVGSDSAAMQMTAEKDGDEWELNGTKQWITNADFAQVFARTTPQEEPGGRYDGITCFIVVEDEWEFESINNTPAEAGQQTELLCSTTSDSRPVASSERRQRVLRRDGLSVSWNAGTRSTGRRARGARAGSGTTGRRGHLYFQLVFDPDLLGRRRSSRPDSRWERPQRGLRAHGSPELRASPSIVEGTDELQLNTIAKQNGFTGLRIRVSTVTPTVTAAFTPWIRKRRPVTVCRCTHR